MPIYKALTVRDLSTFRRVLKDYAIPTIGWHKTKSQLFGQMEEGETVLARRRGRLWRITWRSQANVFRTTPRGRRERLREVERIVNGRKLEPSQGPSISEKLVVFPFVRPRGFKPETHLEAMIRCFLEELGITVVKRRLTFIRVKASITRHPDSFPIPTINFLFLYDYEMLFEETKEEYVELRNRKKTTWKWKRYRRPK